MTMCNITFCNVDSKVDQFFQPTLYIIVIILGLPTNCMALWAAYMQVRDTYPQFSTSNGLKCIRLSDSGFQIGVRTCHFDFTRHFGNK